MAGKEVDQLKQGFQDVLDKLCNLEQKIDGLRGEINEYAGIFLDAKKEYVESISQFSGFEIRVAKQDASLLQLKNVYDTVKTTMERNCPYCRIPDYDYGYHL